MQVQYLFLHKYEAFDLAIVTKTIFNIQSSIITKSADDMPGTLGLEHTKKERKNLLGNFLHQSQKWLTAKNKFLVFRATAASRDFVNFYKFTYWARFFTTYLIKNYLPKRLIL